ncbi:MAG: choice-of-anchor tandem repeat GloVer-containing protein [Verrucomicrobiia bacterium]
MRPAKLVYFLIFIVLFPLSPAWAAGRQVLPFELSAVVTNSSPVGRLPGTTNLDLAIGLPLRDREGLTNLLRKIYDPTSVEFRHFLTPDEFAARFGPTEKDYQAVIAYAQANGFTVTATHPNRLLLDVRGSVGVIESAFKVRMSEYQHPTGKRKFYAPDAAPSLNLAVPVLGISGLNNYAPPQPRLVANLITNVSNTIPNAGSGPGGTYAAYDFRAAYVPGWPLTGTGQRVGLLQFDGYHSNDIAYYESRAGLSSVTLSNVLLNGVTGNPSGGGGEVEVSLDIESSISMAPGLSMVIVYEGSSWHDILNRMATDNLAKQLSCSWYIPGGGPDAVADQIWQQMAAQGQSFFNASGDADAYTGPIDFPGDTPFITQVGGTTLTTSGAGGRWVSETVWNWGGGSGSGGGISTSYSIPSWQTNINMTANQGSTTRRNTPDVALTADNVYVRADNKDYNVGGTSCAAPLWAGFASLINQVALQNGEPPIGFVNPAVYALGQRGDYTLNFHDITTGNNEKPSSLTKFAAVTGYDLCTGWGTPTGSNLLYALGVPEPLRIVPGAGFTFTGPVGGPFNSTAQIFSLTNNAGAPLSWSLACTSAWLNVTPTGGILVTGGAPATVTASLSSLASNLPAAGYSATIWFTNLNNRFVQSRQLTLAIVSPPVITAQPADQAVFEGATATFTVGTTSNALMFYQWQQDNGSYLTNLSDGGTIAGAATSTLTVSNVSAANAGAYYVTVTNAAGTATSAAAFLTIIPWRPVITQQPVSQTLLPGAPASFTVAAVGTHPFTYGWQLNGTNLADNGNISGSSTANLTIGNATVLNAGTYTVVVSNALGMATSSGALLNIISVTTPGVTLSSLSSFMGGSASGEFPYGPLVLARDGNFYGTTIEGGANGYGTIFRLTTNGVTTTRISLAYSYGALPYAGLALGRDGLLYGTASQGGGNGYGTIFRTTTGAITPAVMANFNEVNGYYSTAGLVQGSDTNFYGTTLYGGAFSYGNIFRVTPTGSLTDLHDFNYTDGGYPSSVLIQTADGSLYGTTQNGGPTGWGTVFKITPAGALTTVHAFHGQDGGVPVPGLVQDTDGSLYGTTYSGGTNDSGSIFRIAADGTFTNLYSFIGGADGSNPYGGLLLAADGNFYGTAMNGGTYADGTVFRIDRDGTFTTLAEFDGFQGAGPAATLAQGPDGNLYGTTVNGGTGGFGTVFRIRIDGPLQITSQPEDKLVYLGGTPTFSVSTVGSQPVVYQWQKSGTNLVDGSGVSGSASRLLTITNVDLDNAGVYSLVASNSYGSVTSRIAFLEIMVSPPLITTQPVSQSVLAGSTVRFTVGAAGDQPFYYQWMKNGTNLVDGGNISGSATGLLTVSGAAATDDGAYSVVVSDDFYWATSDDADLAVLPIIQTGSTLNTLHSFVIGTDGGWLNGLVQGTNGSLYGTAQSGGANGYGTAFRITTNGVMTISVFNQVNGAYPYAGVVQATDGNFYGTTLQGGAASAGNVFKLSPVLGVTSLYSFTGGTDGNLPTAGLVQGSDNNFYGTTYEGGTYGNGTVFKIATNGAFTALYSFQGGNDGYGPWAGLVQGKDGNFYGITEYGGLSLGQGTVFKVTPTGTLTTLHTFHGAADGAYPTASLIQAADGNYYGTTSEGGTNDNGGTVFKMAANGVVTILHQFGAGDGASPAAGLVQGSDGNLYGTTELGGLGGYGTAFTITTNGVLNTIVWFNWSIGAYPTAPLIQATDGNFYGTTAFGGVNGFGTVFRLNVPLPPHVVVQPTNQIVYAGMNTAFQVVATGAPQLTYQWRLNGTNLADGSNFTGTGTGTLLINNASAVNAGTYSVVITNLLGTTTSTGAVLTVASPPMISNVTCNPDGSVTLNLSTAPYTSSRILVTTNLVPPVVWQPIFTNVVGSNGAWQFIDRYASNYPVRFYRSSTP